MDPIRIFPARGVNLRDDQRRIGDDECVRAKNLIPVKPGILKKRPAMDTDPQTANIGLGFLSGSLGQPVAAGLHPKKGGPFFVLYHSIAATAKVAWAAATAYNAGDRIWNNSESAYYVCVQAGTSGAGPAPSGLGSWILDGTVRWTAGNGQRIGSGMECVAQTPDGFNGLATKYVMDDVMYLNDPVHLAHGETLYVFPGYPHKRMGWAATWDGISKAATIVDVDFSGSGNNYSPSVVAMYRNRAVYANFGPGYESYVVMADPFTPTVIGDNVLAANGRSFTIGTGDGDKIVAMVPITQTSVGSPAAEALLILKENSAYILTGEPDQTTTSGTTKANMLNDMVVSKISYNCGCVSQKTVATTPYGIFWASADDVWFFATGSLPIRVGSKIRPALEQSPADLRFRWHGAYYNGFYRLAVHSEGQGPTDISMCGEQWWLDLRLGPVMNAEDAQWWGPQIYAVPPRINQQDPQYGAAFGTSCFFLDERAGFKTRLFGFVQNYFPYTNQGVFVEFDLPYRQRDLESYSSESSRHAAHGYGGTSIDMELLTKEYDFGVARKYKGFLGLEADVVSNFSDYLRLKVIAAGGATLEECSKLVEQPGFNLGVDGVSLLGDTSMSREFQPVAIWPDPSTSKLGTTLQFKLYDQAGYTIDSNTDLLIVHRTGGTVAVQVSLTQGYYASFKALIDHVVSRLNATVGGGYTFSHNWTGDTTGLRPAGGTWTLSANIAFSLRFQSDALGGASAAQLAEARGTGALLGLATGADMANATSIASEAGVFSHRTADWEIGDLAVNIRLFERGPA